MSQTHYDALGHWAEASACQGSQLVRILSCQQYNRYLAHPIGFTSDGSTLLLSGADLSVTNLAEPANAAGTVPANTDALAIDAGGRWIVFVRNAAPSLAVGFVGKVMTVAGSAHYIVHEQVLQNGAYHDKAGAADISADNLAELTLGPGAAVDVGTFVSLQGILDGGSPPTLRYVFDHPLYAKYLN